MTIRDPEVKAAMTGTNLPGLRFSVDSIKNNTKVTCMKTIILNGSPRKNWNTALMLKEARKGAESVGAEAYSSPLREATNVMCESTQTGL